MKSSVSRSVAAMVLWSGLAVVPVMTAPVQGQIMITSTMGVGGEGPAGMVGKASVEKYAALLKMSPDQKEAATTIHEGYAASFRQAAKDQQAAFEELRRSSEDSDDRGEFMKKMPEIQKKHSEMTKKLESGLFADIKSLLTPEQEQAWPKVERMRRREVGLPQGSLAGESVDLSEVVEGLKVDAATSAALVETLEQYETELDRQITAREKALAGDDAWEPGKPLDMEKIQARMKITREAGEKVQEVNEKFARKIEGLLPEAQRPVFAEAVKKRSFPRVYKPSRVGRSIDAALKLDDVDSGQRQSLSSLKESYERDAAPANEAWANAIRDSEKSGANGTMGMRGGGQISINFGGGEDEKGPLADARKARRDLDDRTNERLKKILTEAQRAKLPKDDAEGRMIDGGDRMMIRRSGGG